MNVNESLRPGDLFMFLAGPIMGAADWQQAATHIVSSRVPEDVQLHLANPRWTDAPPANRLPRDEQRTWEKDHYRAAFKARELGVTAFYIASESIHAPFPNSPGRAFGQGTRSEFGEALGTKLNVPEVNIVLGISPSRAGNGLHEYYHTAAELGLPIHHSVEAVCIAALERILPQGLPQPG